MWVASASSTPCQYEECRGHPEKIPQGKEEEFFQQGQVEKLIGSKSPGFKILADAQGTDDFPYLILERENGRIVEMVPVVVAHDQDIDSRDICRRVDIAARKGVVGEKDGGSVANTKWV